MHLLVDYHHGIKHHAAHKVISLLPLNPTADCTLMPTMLSDCSPSAPAMGVQLQEEHGPRTGGSAATIQVGVADSSCLQRGAAHRKYLLGLLFVAGTASCWLLGSFVIQHIVTSGPTASKDYLSRSFLVTYMISSLATCYLPLHYGRRLLLSWWNAPNKHYTLLPVTAAHDIAADSPLAKGQLQQAAEEAASDAVARKQALTAALWAAPLSFLAQYTFNISLALTNITSNTILYSTSSLFTFGLSVLLLKEHITARKLLCILACIAGTALVTLSDVEGSSAAPSHDSAATGASSQGQGSSSVKASGTGLITFPGAPILGDVMVLLSSALYAGYTVVMKLKMPGEEEDAQVALFFGYIGMFCSVGLAPVMIALLATGALQLGDIPAKMYLAILLMGLIDYLLSDYLWARAVLLLGPTIASISLTMEIPLAGGLDLIWGHPSWPHSWVTMLMTAVGTAFVLVGCFGVELDMPDDTSSKPAGSRDHAQPVHAGHLYRPISCTAEEQHTRRSHSLAHWLVQEQQQADDRSQQQQQRQQQEGDIELKNLPCPLPGHNC